MAPKKAASANTEKSTEKKTEKKSGAPAKAPKAPKKSAKTGEPEEKEHLTEAEEAKLREARDENADDDFDEDLDAGAGGSSSSPESMMPSLSDQQISASMKNFRNHPDMENFYRFIYENDLRIEALQIIDRIIADRKLNPVVIAATTATKGKQKEKR